MGKLTIFSQLCSKTFQLLFSLSLPPPKKNIYNLSFSSNIASQLLFFSALLQYFAAALFRWTLYFIAAAAAAAKDQPPLKCTELPSWSSSSSSPSSLTFSPSLSLSSPLYHDDALVSPTPFVFKVFLHNSWMYSLFTFSYLRCHSYMQKAGDT